MNSSDTAQRFGVDIQSGWAFLLSSVNLNANPCLPAARMNPLFMYLACILPKKYSLVYKKNKTDFIYLSPLASTALKKKKISKKTTQANPIPKLHKITNFPKINKINLPHKAKVPEKK